jgi:hypothetical protein
MGQAIPVVLAYAAWPFGVYYAAIMLPLTCGACALAWAKKPRGFVLLALASQLINGFVTVGYALSDGAALFYAPPAESRHLLQNVSWDLVVLVFASTIVAYLTPRYVSVRGPTSAETGRGTGTAA